MKIVITNYEVQLARSSGTEFLRIISGASLAFSGDGRLCTCLDREGLHVVEPEVAVEVVFAPGLGMDARALFALSCADHRAVRVEEFRSEGRDPQRLLAEPCCRNPAYCPLRPRRAIPEESRAPAPL